MLRSNRKLHKINDPYSSFEWCAAFDSISEISIGANAFDSLKKFHEEKKDWLFGFLTYDLKNELEKLSSENNDGLGFPSIHFFQPDYILMKNNEGIHFSCHSGDTKSKLLQLLQEIKSNSILPDNGFEETIRQNVSRDEYIKKVNEIKKHIQRGDIYEMNYCVEFFGNGRLADPASIYEKLNELSPMPFSCFYKNDNQYMLSASPERFIAKRGSKIISQPIKGTARRGNTEEEDQLIIEKLRNDEKE